MAQFAREAAGRGIQVIIAGAGGAAHLPGMLAAQTLLPVLGVPVLSKLSGLDSLLSIVQMPAGVPVGTLAIGAAGAKNAALLAASILALHDSALLGRLGAFREKQTAESLNSTLEIRMTAAPSDSRFPPGSTVGVMGSGQLGRMFAIAARRMGYRIHVFSPETDTPAGQLADLEVAAAYEDEAAVTAFARGVDVLTFEFENIPVRTAQWAAAHCIVRPAGKVLHICQHRLREKQFLASAGIPVAPFVPVANILDLRHGLEAIGVPAILKTAAFGYDGKGQRKITTIEEAGSIDLSLLSVLEGFIPFEKEISVLIARGVDGQAVTFPVCENIHRNHILDLTVAPARLSPAVERSAREIAHAIAEKLT